MHIRYALQVADPRPRMTQTTTLVDVETYAAAVEAARSMFRVTGRRITLVTAHASGTPSTYPYHTIRADGTFEDRNTNSGIPESGTIAA